jgi:hypothetical protein
VDDPIPQNLEQLAWTQFTPATPWWAPREAVSNPGPTGSSSPVLS